jgi:hypothetical protein
MKNTDRVYNFRLDKNQLNLMSRTEHDVFYSNRISHVYFVTILFIIVLLDNKLSSLSAAYCSEIHMMFCCCQLVFGFCRQIVGQH